MFAEVLTAVIVLLMILSAWFDFAKMILKIIWMLRIPLLITLAICYGPKLCDWMFGTNLVEKFFG